MMLYTNTIDEDTLRQILGKICEENVSAIEKAQEFPLDRHILAKQLDL
jgi:hypothetical protein